MLNIDKLLGIEITKGNPLKIYHPIHGKVIYSKNSNGYEYWNEYDTKGHEIHSKNSNGYEYWKEYDSQGNLIHHKDSNGDESWQEWDSLGNLIYRNSNGKVYLDKRKKSFTKSEIAEKLGITVEDVVNAQ